MTTSASQQTPTDAALNADVVTSSDDYAARFAGPAGEWMLKVQEDITLGLLRGTPGASVLDVGGGHGQLALPLCRAGFRVTVAGSAESCRHRLAAVLDAGQCAFTAGNLLALPWPDRQFDVVLCFRLITHCEPWPALIAELCRLARRSVIVDYPTSRSLNKVAPLLFGAKKKVEQNTRTWTLFTHGQIARAFEANGFGLKSRHPQFFLPMVLHRMLKRPRLSAGLERVCRGLGLTRLLGSPVIAEMRRHD
ncbi:MAG: methyltransferase domain-containing protein [Kiritimatiellae bacterium]|nr:methyltransferase domain-containing protein [Kiritimatiellia bacterium]